MNGTNIDRLYVTPNERCKGWDTRFIQHAKQLSPQSLSRTRIKQTTPRER